MWTRNMVKSHQIVIYRSVLRLFSCLRLSVRRADYSNLAALSLVPGLTGAVGQER